MKTGLVLGIETSCDDTGAAVVEKGRTIRSNVISSQVEFHQKFGGVVPEIASRKHVELILPVIDAALQEADVEFSDLEAVAVTYGPGLVGSLLVGLTAAKTVAYAAGLPLVGVNHIEGHIYANFLEHPEITPPLVCLTVSGGHSDLLYIPDYGVYKILGRTRDDAAGEAFDKIARVLGLGYPGGPAIDALAAQGGNPEAIEFPRALLDDTTFDFSFSGLKTAALNEINRRRQRADEVPPADFAASFQEAIVDVLATKAVRAAKSYGVKQLILSGGVGANSRLRRVLDERSKAASLTVFYPSTALCTDNAAMIASAGYFHYLVGHESSLALNAYPGLQLVERDRPKTHK